jgi:hypothetical protein
MYYRNQVYYSRVVALTGKASGETEGISRLWFGWRWEWRKPQEGVIYQLPAKVFDNPSCILPGLFCRIIQLLQEV